MIYEEQIRRSESDSFRGDGAWTLLKSVSLQTWGTQSALSLADQGLTASVGFGVNLLLARWMAPELYGAFAVVFAIYLFLTGFHNVLLLEPLSVVGPARYSARVLDYFRGQLQIHAIAVWPLSAMFALSGLILWRVDPGNRLVGALLGIGVALPFLLLLWLVRRMCYVVQRPSIAVVGSAFNVGFVLGGLYLLRAAHSVTPFSAFVLTGVGSLLASGILIHRLEMDRPSETPLSWRLLFKENWIYGRWLVGSTILFSFSNQAQTFLVAGLLGLSAAGILRAMQIPMLAMMQITTAVGLLILPNFADSFSRNSIERLHHKAIVISVGIGGLALLFVAVLAFIARPLEFLLFKGKYAAYAQLMPLLALIPAFTGMSLGCSMALRASQKPNFDLIANLAAAPAGIISAILFIRWWGLMGAGASMVISMAVYSIVVWYLYAVRFREYRKAQVAGSLPESIEPEFTSIAVPAAKAESFSPKVALLTNCLTPYLLPVFQCLTTSVKSLRIFVSIPMEPDRHWKPTWDGVDVKIQKTITTSHREAYKQGFSMTSFRHFPYDSLPLLRDHNPDVVISAELGFRTLQAIFYRTINRRTRLVLWIDGSEHTTKELSWARTMSRKLFVRAADAFIVNGASGSRYVRSLGISSDRIIAAPYVAGSQEFSSVPLVRRLTPHRRLLYVGQLIERKGLTLLFRELARWAEKHPDKQSELWLVGDGPMRRQLEQFQMPPQVKLQFFGNVEYFELPSYYSKADVLVLPCLADTWAVVVNESLAAGVPVLGSLYSQAVEDLVRDGVNGWTFYPDHRESFERALDRAFSTSTSRLAQMSTNARSSVAHLTPQYSADQFLRAVRIATAK